MVIMSGGAMRRVFAAVISSAALLVSIPALPAVAAPTPSWFERGTPMAPRLQWNANDGYCGETSFISAGMLFGQYTSQWTARLLASPGVPQWESSSQLLLGTSSERRAARAMKLEARYFDSARQRSIPQYLTWVKKRFLRGDAVIIGVLNNTTTLDEQGPGDREYDHIVPVFGFGSTHRLNASKVTYRSTDTITISDNGLHNIGPNYPYLYSYELAGFPRSRSAANAPGGPLYSLRKWPRTYATAITGVADPDGVTIPVRLTSDVNGEGLQNEPVLKAPPAPSPMTLTAHVRIPDQSVAYRVYLYDDFAQVPTRDFNARAAKAIQSWTIPPGSGAAWRVTIDVMTDQTRVFRAVPVTAP